MGTQFPTTYTPDAALIIDALYRFNNVDRASIDAQILGIQQVIAGLIAGTIALPGAAPYPVWIDGADSAFTVGSALGFQNVRIPALTGSHVWKLSNAAALDGMRVKLCDAGYSGSTTGHYQQAGVAGFSITVQGFAGTEHIYAEGKDQGTSYVVPASILGNGSISFEYRASDSTWSLV